MRIQLKVNVRDKSFPPKFLRRAGSIYDGDPTDWPEKIRELLRVPNNERFIVVLDNDKGKKKLHSSATTPVGGASVRQPVAGGTSEPAVKFIGKSIPKNHLKKTEQETIDKAADAKGAKKAVTAKKVTRKRVGKKG